MCSGGGNGRTANMISVAASAVSLSARAALQRLVWLVPDGSICTQQPFEPSDFL